MKKQITLKHDLSVNWAKAINFVPKIDELILYDGVMENGTYVELPRLKQGDGVTKLKDLPFLDSERGRLANIPSAREQDGKCRLNRLPAL